MSTTLARLAGALCIPVLLLGCSGGSGSAGGGLATADVRGVFGGSLSAGSGNPLVNMRGAGDGSRELGGELARELAEANLYAVAGDLLYLLNPYRGLTVVDLAAIRVRGRLALGGVPIEFYRDGDRALALVATLGGDTDLVDVDLTDPDDPVERARLPIPGEHRTSRRVGDALYVVTGDAVHSFDVAGGPRAVQEQSLPDGARFAFASSALLAVASDDHATDGTLMSVLDISDPGGAIADVGAVRLPGRVQDADKLHIAGGTLRVVTHDATGGRLSHLWMIDPAAGGGPAVIGSLDLARGEQLFATRFTDERAYVVTFEQVDPLWVIDLRDPRNPTITAELVVPGWSTHLVPVGTQLVALGVEAGGDWHTVVSLFDVGDPVHPRLASRADFGAGWSNAYDDIKAFGVFPGDGLVLVPFFGRVPGLAVVRLGADTLTFAGMVPATGGVVRGFPHARGLCALSNEELVVADPTTLIVRGMATLAENVVDVDRRPDGELVKLVQKGDGAILAGIALPLVPERANLHGDIAAVTGWDATGRACYVVDLAAAPPTVSPRLDLGTGWNVPLVQSASGRGGALSSGAQLWWGPGSANDSVLTPAGRLVVRSLPQPPYDIDCGDGTPEDGFVVVDLPSQTVTARIAVRGGPVTGFAVDGERVSCTRALPGGFDPVGRPLLGTVLFDIDLDARSATAPVAVPGVLLGRRGDLAFTLDERWHGPAYEFTARVVALRIDANGATRLDEQPLPITGYDYRVVGDRLFVTTTDGLAFGGGVVSIGSGGPGALPGVTTTIATLRLAADLIAGPTIVIDGEFAALLLAERDAALVQRSGAGVQRFDLSGPQAVPSWLAAVAGWPIAARADPGLAGRYLVALGFGDVAELP
ncbi:MAG: beta-propeller domain-containing protein [Planctomycetes bacterium]|nr:beta-propeller domain-containing protein [Planctomycetota bacterium]